jgi:hypothetical protein
MELGVMIGLRMHETKLLVIIEHLMIWVVRNYCIFETVTYANMKQLENNMETHEVYL